MKHKTRQMYCLDGYNSKLNLHCKRMIYKSIFELIWMHGDTAQHFGVVLKQSNIDIIQPSQVCSYVTNEEIHRDLEVKWVADLIRENALRHEKRIHNRTNVYQHILLDTTCEVRRLKRVNWRIEEHSLGIAYWIVRPAHVSNAILFANVKYTRVRSDTNLHDWDFLFKHSTKNEEQ